jgi:peroxiredoxin family protein
MSDNNDRVSIVLFSGDLDKAISAFTIAAGAAATGMQVDMFFTFWGISVLRKKDAKTQGKSFVEKIFGWMLPKGADNLALSKMHMAGIGTMMMKNVMKQKRVASLPELIEMAKQLGVRLHACEMSMGVMGIRREELLDAVKDVVGVATYIDDASRAKITLFI